MSKAIEITGKKKELLLRALTAIEDISNSMTIANKIIMNEAKELYTKE